MSSTSALIAEGYDGAADSFARAADVHIYGPLAQPLVDAVRRMLETTTGTVLDVAAGTGALGRWFDGTVSIDLSQGQLSHNASDARLCADACKMPFRDQSFDVAASSFGINHIAEPTTLVSEMARVASHIGVSTWGNPIEPHLPSKLISEYLAARFQSARTTLGRHVDECGDAVRTTAKLDEVIRRAGLSPSVDEFTVVVPWPGAPEFVDYRLGMPTTAAPRDETLRERLIEEIDALPSDALPWRTRIIVGTASSQSA